MIGISKFSIQKLSFRSKSGNEKRTIIVGLKPDNHSREILLRLLTVVVKPKDNVLAIHVQNNSDDTFDPNTFHIHEDLCKSKQVDFQVKVCSGDSHIQVLTNQVRVSYAAILALGSRLSGPNVSGLDSCLKGLPPTCTLLVINSIGKVLLRRPGTSQQGSRRTPLRPSLSALSPARASSNNRRRLQKSFTAPSPSVQKLFQRLSILETEGYCSKHFSPRELRMATGDFSPAMAIGEDENSTVYRAFFQEGQTGAVKVLRRSAGWDGEEILREIGLLSRVNHENVAKIIGYCDCRETQAIVYGLSRGSLRQNLRVLSWDERMGVALGIAKALNYLHHCCEPPIVHRDLNSSNILLSDDFQPQLSDFGSAISLCQSHHPSTSNTNPLSGVGSFGYLAPEYTMYGKIDEKIDVYSYGVVLLELITGKATHESLVLWARSLLSYGLCERLVDPYLHEDYSKEEMKLMMVAARLCLMHSSSRRPTMKTILRLFEEPEYWLRMQRERDEFLSGDAGSKSEIDLWKRDAGSKSEVDLWKRDAGSKSEVDLWKRNAGSKSEVDFWKRNAGSKSEVDLWKRNAGSKSEIDLWKRDDSDMEDI